MPRKPRQNKRLTPISGPDEKFLLTGDWLLLPSVLDPPGKEVWIRHRRRLLELWRDPLPSSRPWGFSGESVRGCGRLGLPSFGQVVFDGERLPKKDRAWPAEVLKAWEAIRDNTNYYKRSLKNATK